MNDLQRVWVLIDHTDFDSARAIVENDDWPGHPGRGKFRLRLHVIVYSSTDLLLHLPSDHHYTTDKNSWRTLCV